MRKLLFCILSLVLLSCSNNKYSTLNETDSLINLKWNKAYPDDTINKSLIGLKWALSYCGAILPSSTNGIIVSENTITIDLKNIGFTETAYQKLLTLSDKIKASPKYKITSSVDLGRYVTLLIGASEHYYEITGIPSTLNELVSNYELLPTKGYINNSMIASNHRLIQFSKQNGFNQLYISTELDSISGKILEYETIEIIPNGQLRFGIFDEKGKRILAANSKHTAAGKPAKCIWCHESVYNPLFSKQKNVENYLTQHELQNQIKSDNEMLQKRRSKLQSEINYNNKQDHVYTELLYISFMEPSAERLSLEWNVPINEVKMKLYGLQTHIYEEFPFLGNLYHRNEIEKLAPFKSLKVSNAIREFSDNEVHHLN